MKKVITIFLSAIIMCDFFTGCNFKINKKINTPVPPNNNNHVDKPTIKIGFLTNIYGINDKSFNQAADEGIKRAKEKYGISYKVIESKKDYDYESNLDTLTNAEKTTLVFCVGKDMEDAVKDVAPKKADSKFALIDAVIELPNVESFTFKKEEAAFLAGIVAGKMTLANKVGFIGGENIQAVNMIESAFAAGVKTVNSAAAEGLLSKDQKSYPKEVRYGKDDNFTNINKSYKLGISLFKDGCDVVYHTGDGNGEGLFAAAKEITDKGNNKAWAIGDDRDQAIEFPEYAPYILTSAVKRVDNVAYNAVEDVMNNEFKGGKHTILGLKEDGVGLAQSSYKNTPGDVLDLVDKYADLVKDKKITVPQDRNGVLNFKAPQIEENSK
ncbi:MAG: BMP family ABC transporter substrate-binding protein [Clostridiales bacterium]|nr:BMP family ABC transporter substrate-binding protein [Clostridiales bacterium]